ncbi:hypothetical protein SOVF_198920, partial [Spinacia oleracea]
MATPTPQSLSLPFKTRVQVTLLSFVIDGVRRNNGTINRAVVKLFDRHVPPNPIPHKSVSSHDVVFDPSNNLWFRLYVPHHSAAVASLPVIVFFHGGGFSLLSAASNIYDAVCRRFSRELNVVVCSVEYGLCPEHKFPSQYNDGYAILKFLEEPQNRLGIPHWPKNADISTVFLAGDSAGGNLVHYLAVNYAKSSSSFSHLKIAGIINIQPFFGGKEPANSEIELDGMPLITRERSEWMWKAYLPEGEDWDHWAVNVGVLSVIAGLDELRATDEDVAHWDNGVDNDLGSGHCVGEGAGVRELRDAAVGEIREAETAGDGSRVGEALQPGGEALQPGREALQQPHTEALQMGLGEALQQTRVPDDAQQGVVRDAGAVRDESTTSLRQQGDVVGEIEVSNDQPMVETPVVANLIAENLPESSNVAPITPQQVAGCMNLMKNLLKAFSQATTPYLNQPRVEHVRHENRVEPSRKTLIRHKTGETRSHCKSNVWRRKDSPSQARRRFPPRGSVRTPRSWEHLRTDWEEGEWNSKNAREKHPSWFVAEQEESSGSSHSEYAPRRQRRTRTPPKRIEDGKPNLRSEVVLPPPRYFEERSTTRVQSRRPSPHNERGRPLTQSSIGRSPPRRERSRHDAGGH